MNEVERIHEELKAIGQIVGASNDVSAITDFGAHSAKTFLLAGASYFERRIISSIKDHVSAVTTSGVVSHFVLHQALERKFFVLFNFNAEVKNINAFLSKFGPDYSQWAKDDIKDEGIEKNQLDFLNFCRLRNSLVHSNYATYNIDKTLDDVWVEYGKALLLVNWIEASFGRFNEVFMRAAGKS